MLAINLLFLIGRFYIRLRVQHQRLKSSDYLILIAMGLTIATTSQSTFMTVRELRYLRGNPGFSESYNSDLFTSPDGYPIAEKILYVKVYMSGRLPREKLIYILGYWLNKSKGALHYSRPQHYIDLGSQSDTTSFLLRNFPYSPTPLPSLRLRLCRTHISCKSAGNSILVLPAKQHVGS